MRHSSKVSELLLLCQCVNVAVESKDVEFALAVLAKAGGVAGRISGHERAVAGDLAFFVAESPNRACRVISIHIGATQRRDLLTTIDIATGDTHADAVIGEFGFARKASVMGVFNYGVKRLA